MLVLLIPSCGCGKRHKPSNSAPSSMMIASTSLFGKEPSPQSMAGWGSSFVIIMW